MIVENYNEAKEVYQPRKNITMRKIISSKFLSKKSNHQKKKCLKEDFMNLGKKIFNKV